MRAPGAEDNKWEQAAYEGATPESKKQASQDYPWHSCTMDPNINLD